MGMIEELNRIYNKTEQKEQSFEKEIISTLESKLEELESEIIGLKKRIEILECDTGIIGGAVLD